jgi:uncharacterized RDD family membrane protein YckC
MDQPNPPQEPTQAAVPTPPQPPTYPAADPLAQSPGYQPQPWAIPPDVLGPAPGVLFASHGGRLVAFIVDSILVSVLVITVVFALGVLTAGLAAVGALPLAAMTGILLVVAIVAVSLGYFPWFWVHGGATPGMRMFNLRLVRDRDGGPLGWGEAILRSIGMWVSGAVFYVGYIWIFVDRRRRGWHDLIGGTVMVQKA